VLLIAPLAAAAPELHSTHQIGIASFPLGAQYIFEEEVRFPLWGSDNPLLRDAAVSVFAHAELTPSFPRVGPVVRIAPVAFWDATFRLWGTWYFGAFSSILPFDDPEAAATAEVKRAVVASGARSGGLGIRADAETRLKGKVGPVIAVLEVSYRRHHVEAFETDLDYFWEPTEMLLVPADGAVLNRNAYLFGELRKPTAEDDRKLWIGAVAFWQLALGTQDENLRIGPVAFWKPAVGPNVPTMIIGSQAWVESRFVEPLPPYTFVAASWAR
jgi:hypothetical protein